MPGYTFEPIGYIRSCFKEKFGIPRQPGLVQSAGGVIEMQPFCSQPEAFRHLESFSHIWILFVFHQSLDRLWKPTVRPPRLGGNQRVGVFASRSGFRPNAIGQSAVELISLNCVQGNMELHIGGVDLLDGTPVLDIKPYIPYSDALPAARAGYAPNPPQARWKVRFSEEAAQCCKYLGHVHRRDLKKLIVDLLAIDPRPGYRNAPQDHKYGMRLWDLNIRFRFTTDHIVVESIESIEDC